MNDLEPFPTDQFYDALMSLSGLEQKIDPILKEINSNNIQITYQTIVQIHHILNSKLEPPLMKFNALNCTQILFDTCQYPVILLIEVYLLPIIFEIAAFKASKKSQQSLSLYFIQRGAHATKQVKKLGYNYVILAIEFIYVSAQVKMFRVLENDQLQQQSNFKKISKALKMRGVFLMNTLTFYNQTYSQKTRKIYIDKLHSFNPEQFIEFFNDLVYEQVTLNKRLELDSKRLIMFGDVFIISPLVDKIEDQLNKIDGNFSIKTKFLLLLFQLVKYGFAEAILLLNSSQFLPSIVSEIQKVNGNIDMDEGRWIYQQLNDNQKDKKQFYLEFLKCIETWSHAVPLNQFNEDSDPKRLFQYLKYEKKFKFPDNPNLHKYKSQMEIYIRQNAQRNEKVMQIIENSQTVSAKSKYKISSLKDESNIKAKKTMQFQDLQQIVINTMRTLQIVGFSEKRYDKDMKKLSNFNQNWHVYIEKVKKNIQNDQEPYNLDMLISQGEIVYGQILQLQKIYNAFKSDSIKFSWIQEKITQFFNQFQNQNPTSQVSVSPKSKNTRLTNRRDLKSKISQKARNDKQFSDHSKHSYLSLAKSAKSNFKSTKNYNIRQSKAENMQNYNQINQTFALNYQPKQQAAAFGLPQNSLIQQKLASNLKKNSKKEIQKFQDSYPIESSFKKKPSDQVKNQNQKEMFSNVYFGDDSSSANELQFFIKKVQNKSGSRKDLKESKSSHKNKKSMLSKVLSSDKVEFSSNQESEGQNSHFSSIKMIKNLSQKNNKRLSKIRTGNIGSVSGYFNQQSVRQYGIVEQNFDKKAKKIPNMKFLQINKNGSKLMTQSLKSQSINKSRPSDYLSSIQRSQISKMSEVNKSSPSQTISNLQTSQQIKNPSESFQMLQSHYKTSEVQSKKLQQSLSEKNFVQTIQVNKQIIHSPYKILTLSNHLNQQKTKPRMENLLQAKGLMLKSSKHKKNIMEVLSERSAKKGIEDYMMQKQKNKLIKNLNLRIKLLESQQHTIKTKLSKKDDELIHSLSLKNYSQNQNMKFKTSENTSLDFNQNEQNNTSLAYQIKVNNNSIKSSKAINQLMISSKTQSSKQNNLIDVSQYDNLFKQFKHDMPFKKNCLRNKSLLLSNDYLEIGCMSLKKDSFINFTLFITAKQFSVKNVKFQVEQNENLQINLFPDCLYTIKAKRQESVNVKIVVKNISYEIPKLRIYYQIDKEQFSVSKKTNNFNLSAQVHLPCTFNKLCSFNSLKPNDFYEMFNSGSQNSIISIKKFKLNQKIFNDQKLKEYFPYFTVLKCKEELSTGKVKITYGFEVNFNGNMFLVLIKVQDKKYALLEVKNMTGQKKTQKIMEFFISTFKFLLQN